MSDKPRTDLWASSCGTVKAASYREYARGLDEALTAALARAEAAEADHNLVCNLRDGWMARCKDAEALTARLQAQNATAWNRGHAVGLTALREAEKQWAAAREGFRNEMQQVTDNLLKAEAERDKARAELTAALARAEAAEKELHALRALDDSLLVEFNALRAELDRLTTLIHDEWTDRVQVDLENGVKWLNEQAAEKWCKEYPEIAGFGKWLEANIPTPKEPT